MLRLRNGLSACFSEAGRLDELSQLLDGYDRERLLSDWLIWARGDQLPVLDRPGTRPWRTWLLLGGRGAGKTRSGAEWVRAQALGIAPLAARPAMRIAIVGESLSDARTVMVEGVSGLIAVHASYDRPVFEPSRRQLTWPNGAIAQLFSAEEPDGLRGPQFEAAWCDEICKWRHADETWDMLQFGLRLGAEPRAVVTTTPRPIPLLKRLLADPDTLVSRSRTEDNASNLSGAFLQAVRERYRDSLLGRQELDGELIEERADALWRRASIDAHRVRSAPELERIVVAVDPPVSSGGNADECGIIVAGRDAEGRGYIIADRSVQGRQPLGWAQAAVAAYREHAADCLVAEVNQGGDLVESIIRQVDAGVPVKKVRATRGKWLRAEPVAALYAQGLVSHVGALPLLEDQMSTFGPDGRSHGHSPDRLDALVWAVTELMLSRRGAPRVRNM